jgi:hypothetical protein
VAWIGQKARPISRLCLLLDRRSEKPSYIRSLTRHFLRLMLILIVALYSVLGQLRPTRSTLYVATYSLILLSSQNNVLFQLFKRQGTELKLFLMPGKMNSRTKKIWEEAIINMFLESQTHFQTVFVIKSCHMHMQVNSCCLKKIQEGQNLIILNIKKVQ